MARKDPEAERAYQSMYYRSRRDELREKRRLKYLNDPEYRLRQVERARRQYLRRSSNRLLAVDQEFSAE